MASQEGRLSGACNDRWHNQRLAAVWQLSAPPTCMSTGADFAPSAGTKPHFHLCLWHGSLSYIHLMVHSSGKQAVLSHPVVMLHRCEVGSYSPGYNRQPCLLCGTGMTTQRAGSAAVTDCIALQGWHLTGPGTASQCPKGEHAHICSVGSSRCAVHITAADTTAACAMLNGKHKQLRLFSSGRVLPPASMHMHSTKPNQVLGPLWDCALLFLFVCLHPVTGTWGAGGTAPCIPCKNWNPKKPTICKISEPDVHVMTNSGDYFSSYDAAYLSDYAITDEDYTAGTL